MLPDAFSGWNKRALIFKYWKYGSSHDVLFSIADVLKDYRYDNLVIEASNVSRNVIMQVLFEKFF